MLAGRRTKRTAQLLLCAALLGLGSCSTDRHTRTPDPDPPAYESRTGVPILMDIPILGFFFSHTRVER